MKKQKLISIIVPFCNMEKYVDVLIPNVLEQTYQNYELILIDDGSIDNSCKLIKKYKDKRIKLYSQKRLGVSVARNLGIEKANGEYIAFMDCDDTLESEYLNKVVEAFSNYDVDVIMSNYYDIVNKKKEPILLPWNNEIIGKDEIQNKLIPITIYSIKNEPSIRACVWRTFIKKDFIISNNIVFPPGVVLTQDLLFLLQVYNKTDKIYIMEDCLYNYYRNVFSAMNKYHLDGFKNQTFLHKNYLEILKKEKLYEKNKDRYHMSRLAMYTISISNAVRNPKGYKEIYKEISGIREQFMKEKINFMNCNISFVRKISLIMLKIKAINTLMLIYFIKEKIRTKRYRK